MVATPGHPHLLQQQNPLVMEHQQFSSASTPKPPNNPGRSNEPPSSFSPARNPTTTITNNNHTNNVVGGSLGGGSNASRGSSGTRPSSSPEGRSVRSGGGGSKEGSMENQREAAAAAGSISEVEGGDQHHYHQQQQLQHQQQQQQHPLLAASSPAGGGAGTTSPVRPSLAINTARSPVNINTASYANALLAAPSNAPGAAMISNSNSGGPNSTPPKTKGIPKNPKDTAAYVSPGAGGMNNGASALAPTAGGGGAAMTMGGAATAPVAGGGSAATGTVGGASPKRRMKSMERTDFSNFNPSNGSGGGNNFGSNFAVNDFAGGVAVHHNHRGGGNSFAGSGGANFAGSGGGSVGVVGDKANVGVVPNGTVGGSSVGGTSHVGGKSVRSVPAMATAGGASPYGSDGHGGSGYHAAGGHAGRSSSHGQRAGTVGSSPLLNDGTHVQGVRCNTPGSAISLHSMKDSHHSNNTVGVGTLETARNNNNSSMPNIHNNNQQQHMHHPGNHTSRRKNHSLDDEEQFMFEQRLTQDELGVAIRKISHSGKAQLRYVKCVPLRPPSSSDFDDIGEHHHQNHQQQHAVLTNVGSGLTNASSTAGGSKSNNNKNAAVPYLDPQTGRSAKPPPSDSISVSSKSSTGSRFLERMRSTSSGMRRLIPTNNNNGNNINTGGLASSSATLTLEDRGLSASSNDHHNLLLLQNTTNEGDKSSRALTWGKKNAVTLSLEKFTCVRKGKTTERTARNSSPSSRLLSIITCVRGNESLDIEAPTMLDRDKFASAFARFLGVPLVEEEEGRSRGVASSSKKKIRTPSLTRSKKKHSASQQPQLQQYHSAARSEPGPLPSPSSTPKVRNRSATNTSDSILPALTPNSDRAREEDRELAFDDNIINNNNNEGSGRAGSYFGENKQTIGSATLIRKVSDTDFSHNAPFASAAVAPTANASMAASGTGNASLSGTLSKHTMETMSESARKRISHDQTRGESMLEPSLGTAPPQDDAGNQIGLGGAVNAAAAKSNLDLGRTGNNHPSNNNDNDNHSHVSSLTGGVDQEIVEELHQAIIELRSELDASRAEAARAVKVAEQAIQSAENCTSSDWNSTVTHKAAEAAAQAQKKSAEAIARARMAEERLAAERKSTSFWRRQAQGAEEESGSLKTRSAAAEVKQAIVMEELASERRKAARMFASLKSEFVKQERKQGEEMTLVQDRKRALEVELEELQEELEQKGIEAQRKEDAGRAKGENKPKGPNRMVASFRRPRNASQPRQKSEGSKSRNSTPGPVVMEAESEATKERCMALQSDVTSLRKQFELVRHTSMDEILALHRQSEEWSSQASRAVAASTAETDYLRQKLAAESAMRLKLLNELQDIRGTVRVYCRPKPVLTVGGKNSKSIVKIPTHDILVLNEEAGGASFKYDRVFAPGASQYEVFSELEEPLISSLDGFNVTLLAFGAGGSGKTHTLLGQVGSSDDDENDLVNGEEDDGSNSSCLPSSQSHGVQLQAIQQLFTIASHRTDRYKDSFSMTVVEVHNEKLSDLVAGTPSGERDGEVVVCETRDGRRDKRRESSSNDNAAWRKGKLEIRTNIDGNTVVQGLVSVPIQSFDDAVAIWKEAEVERAARLQRQGVHLRKHERKTNVITSLHIKSVNIATGVGTEGKLQFVDMAASDVMPGAQKKARDDSSINGMSIGDEDTAKFANKSIEAFDDVINARCQFDRSVPYRNSTLTHLLRDSLEADTKVLLMCCVSSEQAHLADTVGALKFANRMQKVSIGKATKHIIGSKE